MHSGCNTLYLNSLEHQRLVTDLTLVYLLDHNKTIWTSLQIYNHNTLSLNFYRPEDALLTPNQQCQSTEGNSSAFMQVNLKASKVQLMKSSHLILKNEVDLTSGKSGPMDQVALHYYYTLPSHWCMTHGPLLPLYARTISRHADGISRYSVPPSAGPLLPLDLSAFQSHCCFNWSHISSWQWPAGLRTHYVMQLEQDRSTVTIEALCWMVL